MKKYYVFWKCYDLKNNSTTRIDMTDQKNGIYLVRFKQGNKTIVEKLVKE